MNNSLFESYNDKESLLVIAGFPKKKETYSQGVCAVSSFTKNTLKAIQRQNPTRKIVVLTMTLDGKKSIYEEGGMLIIRCITRNKVFSYLELFKYIKRFNKIKYVLLEFEFASFGGTLMTSFLAPVVWAMFFMGKNLTLVIHQVLYDMKKLYGHLGVGRKNPFLGFLNLGMPIFYYALCKPASNIIVLEEEFRQRLGKVIGFNKIKLIPHGVDTDIRNGVTQEKAKELIGVGKDEFVILCFGYLTWYKGSDFIVKALKNVNKIGERKIKIVMAGGPSFTQGEKTYYKKFENKIKRDLKLAKNIILSGFVEEKDIHLYYKAANLVVLPYRVFMSSSGPLSLAFSFRRPFIMSSRLKKFSQSSDFKRNMETIGIKERELFFNLTKKDLIDTIEATMETETINKLEKLSALLNEGRSFKSLGLMYGEILSPNVNKSFLVQPTAFKYA